MGALMNRGAGVYDELRKVLAGNSSYEVRWRIREIVRQIYLDEALGAAPAFLGIQHTGHAVPSEENPRVPPGVTGILITLVFPATSAERAGLRSGDIILSLNGEWATPVRPATSFTAWIASQAVGSHCSLGVLRGGIGRDLNRRRVTGFNPKRFAKLGVEVLGNGDDPRIPPGRAGILITDVTRGDPKLELARGDLIIGLNGAPIPQADAEQRFSDWSAGRMIAPLSDEDVEGAVVLPRGLQRPGSERRHPRPVPSAQILRGGRWIELQVVLGRWPPYLSDGRGRRSPAAARAYREADAAFDTWWHDWLALPVAGQPRGATVDDDRAWRLLP